MKFEHLALNVTDPVAMADWYVAHLGMRVLRSRDDTPYTRFLADSAGCIFFELYAKPEAGCPDYAGIPAARFHFGFLSEAIAGDKARLVQAGATLVSEDTTRDGSTCVTLRDPWGVCFQVTARTKRWV